MLYEYSLCNLYGENLRSTISLDNLAFLSQEWKPSPTSKFLTELGKCFAQVCVCLNAFSGGKKHLWIHAVSHTPFLRIKDERSLACHKATTH